MKVKDCFMAKLSRDIIAQEAKEVGPYTATLSFSFTVMDINRKDS